MAVDGDIYVLTKNGSLLRYRSGAKDSFKIKGLEVALNGPLQVYTSVDLQSLYVLDKGNNRIVVLDKEGNLKTQYLFTQEQVNLGLRSISVSRDEKYLLVLAGTKMYKIGL